METTQERPWHKKWRYRLPIAALVGVGLISTFSQPQQSVEEMTVTAPLVQQEAAQRPTAAPAATQSAPKKAEPQTPTTGKRDCNPNYSGCLKPDASDYDCAGGSGNGPYYTGKVRVLGYDEYDLDRDNDGWGCE